MQVAVCQSSSKQYSTQWVEAEDYPEKEALRSIGRLLGSATGNPFQGRVRPGDRVVIKPNWVHDRHPSGLDIFSIVTHPAVLRAIADLVFEAANGDVEIVMADAPQSECNFENLLRVTQAPLIQEYYHKHYRYDLPLLDLRQLAVVVEDGYIRADQRIDLPGDPQGYAVVSMGGDSAFVGMPGEDRLYGADYDRSETIRHHNAERHEYLVSKTILGADLLVSVPKLKTHKMVGVTLNSKGMVGINGNKNWLAHFRIGAPAQGGDQFPDGEAASARRVAGATQFLVDKLLASESRLGEMTFAAIRGVYHGAKSWLGIEQATQLNYDSGNWHGNDTAWRMTADLARIALYADGEGLIRAEPQRRFFSVIDGIVGGEGKGPLAPTPRPAGVLVGGDSLLAVDIAATRLMGFDWRKTKSLAWLVHDSPQSMGVRNPADEIEIVSNQASWAMLLRDATIADLRFEPHPGWKHYLEVQPDGVQPT